MNPVVAARDQVLDEEWIRRPDAWDEIVEAPDIRRAAAVGALRDWVEGANYPWLGWTRAEQLASSALRHNSAHIGEAVTIRSIAGLALDI